MTDQQADRRGEGGHKLLSQFAPTDPRKFSLAVRAVEPWNRQPDEIMKLDLEWIRIPNVDPDPADQNKCWSVRIWILIRIRNTGEKTQTLKLGGRPTRCKTCRTRWTKPTHDDETWRTNLIHPSKTSKYQRAIPELADTNAAAGVTTPGRQGAPATTEEGRDGLSFSGLCITPPAVTGT